MRRIIKWALNHLPRTLLQRLAGWMVPLAGLFYRGRRVECPVCGSHYRKFLPYGYVTSRPNALCPHCLSLERHRLLWLWLVRETRLLDDCPRLLHIAPEVCLMRHLDRLYAQHPERYVTADLESPLAKLHFDVQQIPLEDGFAEVLLCNHILEHVADDRRAMRELFRVLRPGGWGVILSPVDRTRAATFEDDSITDPDERTRIFGQYDHRRIYGRDYADRLREAGFEVLELDYAAACTAEERRRHAVRPGLTGLAQVNGRNALRWEDRFAYDVDYVDHISFALDAKIVLMTLRCVFSREGISAEGSATMEAFTGTAKHPEEVQ